MARSPLVSFALFWLKIGCISFGGPAAHIGLMHREVVDRHKWLDDARFSHALGFCMLLPGPEAQQLATYIGWRLHGVRGALISGSLFVLPSALLLWVLSLVYVTNGQAPAVEGIFSGLQPVVVALIVTAAWRTSSRSLRTRAAIVTAAVAFLLLTIWHVPFPVILVAAAVVGLVCPQSFGIQPADRPLAADKLPSPHRAGLIALAMWLVPVAGLALYPGGLLAQLAAFFSTTSILTFGGAYAILPYVAQVAVNNGWVSPAEMVDGLALSETTPGPLIIVLQFVGFLAAHHQPGALPPLLAGTLGALIATWTTFVPSFAWVFLGAPHIERMRRNVRLSGGLAAVSACVAGIITSLAVWFGSHVLFPKGIEAPDVFACVVCLAALAGHRLGVLPLILLGALAGLARPFLTGG
ncbi:MAG: chromate efflux transporter [Terrimicrobiaceae bacterium]|nr:chromate efflux transporter [Terrimicrobiaceae bacterium]